jgi:hypothetical protein
MKVIYANIESDESISYLKNYDSHLIRIEMSNETKDMLSILENTSVAGWIKSHKIDSNSSLGEGMICGVME